MISPDWGSVSFSTICKSVVLPEPLSPVITTNSSLDFNLDLPDSYAEDSNSNQSENKTEEPAAAPVVDIVAPDTSADNNSGAKAEES